MSDYTAWTITRNERQDVYGHEAYTLKYLGLVRGHLFDKANAEAIVAQLNLANVEGV
jgi:hypothetical protein